MNILRDDSSGVLVDLRCLDSSGAGWICTVESIDGQQIVEFSSISRAISLARFKSLVAIRIGKLERRYVNPADLEFMAFGGMMSTTNVMYFVSYD